jgi:hypothetical protein
MSAILSITLSAVLYHVKYGNNEAHSLGANIIAECLLVELAEGLSVASDSECWLCILQQTVKILKEKFSEGHK